MLPHHRLSARRFGFRYCLAAHSGALDVTGSARCHLLHPAKKLSWIIRNSKFLTPLLCLAKSASSNFSSGRAGLANAHRRTCENPLTLSLFVFRVFANHRDAAFSFDTFALIANLFY